MIDSDLETEIELVLKSMIFPKTQGSHVFISAKNRSSIPTFPLVYSYKLNIKHQVCLFQETLSGFSKGALFCSCGSCAHLCVVCSCLFFPSFLASLPSFLSFFSKLHKLLSQILKARSLQCSLKGSRLGFFLASS